MSGYSGVDSVTLSDETVAGYSHSRQNREGAGTDWHSLPGCVASSGEGWRVTSQLTLSEENISADKQRVPKFRLLMRPDPEKDLLKPRAPGQESRYLG